MRASFLLAACAKVGLDALIDEATGYQYDRAVDALRVKLKAQFVNIFQRVPCDPFDMAALKELDVYGVPLLLHLDNGKRSLVPNRAHNIAFLGNTAFRMDFHAHSFPQAPSEC